jgi:predicted AlkP superfamily pyrophosphatase or phosphodiesterase
MLIVRPVHQKPEHCRRKRLYAAHCAFFAALIFVSLSLFSQTLPGAGRADRHALVISVDGLGASFYTAPSPALRIPNLSRLKVEGSFAEGVEAVYPSVTYPAHTQS